MTRDASFIFSQDQAEAYDALSEMLRHGGVDIDNSLATPRPISTSSGGDASDVIVVSGKAGSGKTALLARLFDAIKGSGVDVISADWEGRKSKERRTVAVLAPTNKAASVLRNHGVPATTIHRILYTPVYDPEYEKIARWLANDGPRPTDERLSESALERAQEFYKRTGSIFGALASAGLRGSDFITGWQPRKEPLDIGLIDEASMLDTAQLDDLKEIFPTLILFGDPAQLPPISQGGKMIFDTIPSSQLQTLSRVHRQETDNPILDLAHALADPEMTFDGFEDMVRRIAHADERVVWAERAESALMARSPVLVWRNVTRIRLINAFRHAYDAPKEMLMEGEPLICDGIELPMKHRRKRLDLEARGLIKGAQAIYLGEGQKPGFSRLHVIGTEAPRLGVASIIKIERPDEDEPVIPYAARMGAVFLHGAAITIHKAQGSQWPEVQVFAPDIQAAARTGRQEAGQALWKRLAYVAITRAEQRLLWVTRNRLSRPTTPLSSSDLDDGNPKLDLTP